LPVPIRRNATRLPADHQETTIVRKTVLGLALAAVAAAGLLALVVSPGAWTGLVSVPGAAPPALAHPDAVPGATPAEQVRSAIAPWCGAVPLTVTRGTSGQAGYTRAWTPWPWDAGRVTEYIEVGGDWPPGHPAATAVALHECAHILQYRAYGYDWPALDRAMRRAYPDGAASGVEHMADCMADAMGAHREGRTADGHWYTAGYGGGCSPAQREAAARTIAGHRL
jgi:hypothetical protein